MFVFATITCVGPSDRQRRTQQEGTEPTNYNTRAHPVGKLSKGRIPWIKTLVLKYKGVYNRLVTCSSK
jgi:hypothetical protein